MRRGIFDKKTFTWEQVIQMETLQRAYKASALILPEAADSRMVDDGLVVNVLSDSVVSVAVVNVPTSGSAVGGVGEMSNLPTLLQLTPRKGKYRSACSNLSTGSYDASTWLGAMGDGALSAEAGEMLRMVCTYQSQRKARHWWNSGYLDEPIQLACEEMKKNFFVPFSQSKMPGALLKIANERIRYLDVLLGATAFLPAYPACREGAYTIGLSKSSISFYRVLLELRDSLVNSVKPRIQLILANASARSDLRALNISFDQVVQHSIGYLFYVLNPMKMPDGFTLDEIRRADAPAYQAFLKTIAGQSLKALIAFLDKPEESATQKNPFFLYEASELHFYDERGSPKPLTASLPVFHELKLLPSGAESAPNPRILYIVDASQSELRYRVSAGGQNRTYTITADELPSLRQIRGPLLDSLKPLRSKILKIASEKGHTQSEQVSTGIHTDFFTPKIMQVFIFLHALFGETINLKTTWTLAYCLSGEGGDILVYGFSNRYINFLLDNTEMIIAKLQTELLKFHRFSYDRFSSLCRANQLGDACHKDWVTNFRKAQMYYAQLVEDLSACRKAISLVRNKANSLTLSERVDQARVQFDKLKRSLEHFSHPANLAKVGEFSSFSRDALGLELGSEIISMAEPVVAKAGVGVASSSLLLGAEEAVSPTAATGRRARVGVSQVTRQAAAVSGLAAADVTLSSVSTGQTTLVTAEGLIKGPAVLAAVSSSPALAVVVAEQSLAATPPLVAIAAKPVGISEVARQAAAVSELTAADVTLSSASTGQATPATGAALTKVSAAPAAVFPPSASTAAVIEQGLVAATPSRVATAGKQARVKISEVTKQAAAVSGLVAGGVTLFSTPAGRSAVPETEEVIASRQAATRV